MVRKKAYELLKSCILFSEFWESRFSDSTLGEMGCLGATITYVRELVQFLAGNVGQELLLLSHGRLFFLIAKRETTQDQCSGCGPATTAAPAIQHQARIPPSKSDL